EEGEDGNVTSNSLPRRQQVASLDRGGSGEEDHSSSRALGSDLPSSGVDGDSDVDSSSSSSGERSDDSSAIMWDLIQENDLQTSPPGAREERAGGGDNLGP
ncbi:unnamed protein product, partial [Discosporangium mesarthrocarpum]